MTRVLVNVTSNNPKRTFFYHFSVRWVSTQQAIHGLVGQVYSAHIPGVGLDGQQISCQQVSESLLLVLLLNIASVWMLVMRFTRFLSIHDMNSVSYWPIRAVVDGSNFFTLACLILSAVPYWFLPKKTQIPVPAPARSSKDVNSSIAW